MYINKDNLILSLSQFKGAIPFDHCVVDDFFSDEIAALLEGEFLEYESPKWCLYKNAIENKKTLNDWNLFPPLTYRIFNFLLSKDFMLLLEKGLGIELFQDPGLHGGGWHIHGKDGNLNPHYDYSIHPKLRIQRKINIIIYLSSALKPEHGGHLGLWGHDSNRNTTGPLIKEIEPKFNRAVIFDTTQNSWHGMSRSLTQPEGVYRKSLAIYYLVTPPSGVDERERALFAPRDDQRGDADIEKLIKTRADSRGYSTVYTDD